MWFLLMISLFLFSFPHEGDELITTCRYNTMDRNKEVVVSDSFHRNAHTFIIGCFKPEPKNAMSPYKKR